MSDAPQVRIAPGLPFALRFIGGGFCLLAAAIVLTALTGGEIANKPADRPMTFFGMLRYAAGWGLGGAGLWWGGGRLRRLRDRLDGDRNERPDASL